MVEMGKIASVVLYLAVYTISSYFMTKSKITETKRIDVSFVIGIMLPVLLAANRHFVGTDFESYYYMYKRMSRCSFINWAAEEMSFDGIPFGIWLISRISFQFNSYKMFYGLLAGVSYFFASLGIKKLLPKESCFLALFFYLTNTFSSGLNISKQVAAVSILIFSLYYVQERKWWKFLITYFLAFCFHPSALIFIVVYFLWKPEDVNFGFKRIVILVFSVVFVFCLPQVLTILGGRFATYIEYTEEVSNRSYYLSLFWLIIFYSFRNGYKQQSACNDILLTMAIFSQVLNLSGFFSPFINRISLYFGASTTMLRAQFPLLFSEFDQRVIKILLFVYGIVIFIISYYVLEGSDIIPYKFYIGA